MHCSRIDGPGRSVHRSTDEVRALLGHATLHLTSSRNGYGTDCFFVLIDLPY